MLLPQGLIRGLATQKLNLDDEADEEDVPDITKFPSQTADKGGEGQANATGNQPSGNTDNADNNRTPGMGSANTTAARATSFIKLNFMGTSSKVLNTTEDSGDSVWRKMRKMASMFCVKKKPPVNSKRHLEPSLRDVILMTAPFLVWGLIVVIIQALGNQSVTSINPAVATFNMVGGWIIVSIRWIII